MVEKQKVVKKKLARLSKEQIVSIAKLRIASVSVHDIAIELKITDGQVRSAMASLKKAGVGFPKIGRQMSSVYREIAKDLVK